MDTKNATAPNARVMAASPCVNVCTIDRASGLCRGCRRTLDEISAWSRLGDDERLGILAALAAREV